MERKITFSKVFSKTLEKANNIAKEKGQQKPDVIHFFYASLLEKDKENAIYEILSENKENLKVVQETLKKELDTKKGVVKHNKLQEILKETTSELDEINTHVLFLKIIDKTKDDFIGSILDACSINKQKVLNKGKRLK